MIKIPRLFQNRCGVFYFRVKTATSDRRVSLMTKCPQSAAIIGLQLNADLERKRAMSNPKLSDFNFDLDALRKYEIDMKNGGRTVRTDGTDADHRRAMEMLAAIDRIGPIPPEDRIPRTPPAPATSPSGLTLSQAAAIWLAERAKKNAVRTVAAKRYHIEDFQRHVGGDPDINTLSKPTVVGYKTARLTEGQTGKTIDNKLMTLHDFFKFLLANAHYTVSASNPVEGLFVLTKRERVAKNEPYQPFTDDDLRAFFDPANYHAAMDSPDFYWGPLIALFTGMRISEVAAIRCVDVGEALGVYYIKIPKSKTAAGVRNVPIATALVGLGFLDYVAEARAAGAVRIFPHRLLINDTYSKRLSEQMLAYLKDRDIKRPNDHKSFHSFRVNVSTALANNGANTAQVMQIVGHKANESHDVHLGYVRDLPDLLPVVDTLRWPVDLSGLAYRGQFNEFVSDRSNWATPKVKKPKKVAVAGG
ncbi:MAG: site-specific integrase [Pseudomonadota bacterium]